MTPSGPRDYTDPFPGLSLSVCCPVSIYRAGSLSQSKAQECLGTRASAGGQLPCVLLGERGRLEVRTHYGREKVERVTARQKRSPDKKA